MPEIDDGEFHNIVPELIHMAVDVRSVKFDPLNARLHPEDNLLAIKRSLTRYGQRKPIVVRKETGIVVAGNGTLKAALDLGWTKIAATVSEFGDVEAAGYGMADNHASDLAKNDVAVIEILTQMQIEAGEVPEYTAVDLVKMRRLDYVPPEREPVKVFADETIVALAFDYFRERGFPYPFLPPHAAMEEINSLASMDDMSLITSTTAYKVADTYHHHRFSAAVTGKVSPVDTFKRDSTLKEALELTLQIGGKIGKDQFVGLTMAHNTQACSNFRPGFALHIYRRYASPGDTVLDTSTGYGGRLVGFMASEMGRYVGIDPCHQTCAANREMVEDLGFSDRVKIVEKAAEDVKAEELGGEGCCDFAFTSPPYFCKERYSDEPTQSWQRYRTGEAWRDGFLLPMLALQYASLRPGGLSVVNIADVLIGKVRYPLVKWAISGGRQVGFKWIERYTLPMSANRLGWHQIEEAAEEPVLVFRKPR